jgi:DNA-binding transcriptional ArsR family regulator
MVQQSATLDRAFAAMADPHRRSILERLSAGPVAASELAAPLEMTLTGVLKHVRLLEDARLVSTHKVGRVRWCRLAPPDSLDEAARWIDQRRRVLEGRLDRFERHIAQMEEQNP